MITVLKSNQKRCNPHAAYVDADGTRHIKMPAELYMEIPEDTQPVDYSNDYYTRREDWETSQRPYTIYERKSDEQIAQMVQQKVNQVSLDYLASTDWMVIRAAEDATKPVPADVLQARSEARNAVVVIPTKL